MPLILNQPTGLLSGIFTPNTVPLDKAGRIDEDELGRYVEWLVQKGVHGLYPNGSTGEFPRFSPEERDRIARIVCQTARGRVPVLVGAAESNIRETLDACERYAGYGARAVAIISPIFYRLGQESITAYFEQIARQSVIDVTVYNIPMLSSPIEVDTVRRLAELERVIGIKDSSGDVSSMCRMIRAIRPQRPAFSFLTGWDPVLVPMLTVGADGGTNASSGNVPEVTRSLYDLFRAGDVDGAMAIQFRLIELFDHLLRGADFPEGFRAGVELRGFSVGGGRQPLSDLQSEDRLKLQRTLECLIADFGVLERPPHCKPTGPLANDGEDDIAGKIAREVIASLRESKPE